MNHRTDPRTMEERWRSMGAAVTWDDTFRAYIVEVLDGRGNFGRAVPIRSVDEVEAFVVAHQEVNRG